MTTKTEQPIVIEYCHYADLWRASTLREAGFGQKYIAIIGYAESEDILLAEYPEADMVPMHLTRRTKEVVRSLYCACLFC